MKITCYLDVTSSWCFWAQPAWEDLKRRYSDRVDFEWKIALMDATGLPASREQLAWFYRRSGMMMRSPFMLNPDWFEPAAEFLAPNLVAEAAKDFGITDDRVRFAISEGAERHGRKVGQWEESLAIAAQAGGLEIAALRDRAQSPEIEARVRASTAEFHAMRVTQRPTFVIEGSIGDRAIFSGIAQAAPLAATLDSMLADEAAYAAHAAHFGAPPDA